MFADEILLGTGPPRVRTQVIYVDSGVMYVDSGVIFLAKESSM